MAPCSQLCAGHGREGDRLRGLETLHRALFRPCQRPKVHGSLGARLLLQREVVLDGAALSFRGRLSLQALRKLDGACINVLHGDCTVVRGAELRMENCSNMNGYGRGGGLYVHGSLQVYGNLEVHKSYSARCGGAVYVSGASKEL